MRGKVLAFNITDGSGLISGEDGQRYPFARAEMMGGYTGVAPGSEVDFQIADGKATAIYVLPSIYEKNRFIAAILAFFLGHWGVHKFYMGKTNAGVVMLICGTIGWLLILPALINWLIALIECVIYLIKSDQQFYQDYVIGDRSWL